MAAFAPIDSTPARRLLLALAMALGISLVGASCANEGLAIMPGVVNSSGNLSLRRALFGFASSEICDEFLQRNIPLQLRDDDPATGRFFPTACAVRELETGHLFLQFSGRGYAWTNVTGRLGFEASAAVEYAHDFQMDGSTMVVYFRQKQTQSTAFRVLMVERTATGPSGGQSLTELVAASVAGASEQIGQRILQNKAAQGFTVVRESDGSVSFTLGLLAEGARPSAPFERGDSDLTVLANERTEVHSGQRDFLGPFALTSEDEALTLTAVVDGAAAVDLVVVPKSRGDEWLEAYVRQPVPTALTTPPLLEDVVAAPIAVAAMPQAPWRRTLKLPPGLYYFVLDQTATAGRTAPVSGALDDRAALVSYAVQRGEAP
jgi:hypothetical protein